MFFFLVVLLFFKKKFNNSYQFFLIQKFSFLVLRVSHLLHIHKKG